MQLNKTWEYFYVYSILSFIILVLRTINHQQILFEFCFKNCLKYNDFYSVISQLLLWTKNVRLSLGLNVHATLLQKMNHVITWHNEYQERAKNLQIKCNRKMFHVIYQILSIQLIFKQFYQSRKINQNLLPRIVHFTIEIHTNTSIKCRVT